MGTAIPERQSVRMSKITNDNPVWYRMLYVPMWQQWASKG